MPQLPPGASISQFATQGGRGVFTRPGTEMKCAGAPLKYTFSAKTAPRARAGRSKAEFVYFSNNAALFSVPIVSEKVRMLFKERNIQTKYHRVLTAIDPGKRIATFETQEVPKSRTGTSFTSSRPCWPQRPCATALCPGKAATGLPRAGWRCDKGTLRHVRYPNVFGVGDIAGVPKGKTAASVKWQVPVAIDHLVAEIQGKRIRCAVQRLHLLPLITRLGQAMLVEFDYENNLTPSFPGVIAPLEELWISWVMKTMALKPTYISMLRGQA